MDLNTYIPIPAYLQVQNQIENLKTCIALLFREPKLVTSVREKKNNTNFLIPLFVSCCEKIADTNTSIHKRKHKS